MSLVYPFYLEKALWVKKGAYQEQGKSGSCFKEEHYLFETHVTSLAMINKWSLKDTSYTLCLKRTPLVHFV